MATLALLTVLATTCGLQRHPTQGETMNGGGSGGRNQPTGMGGASGPGGAAGTSVPPDGGVAGAGGGGTATGGRTGAGAGGMPGGVGGGSGAGIMINGTFVPKEKAVVFIHFGHSNMRGQATVPTSLHPYFYNTQAGLWSYKGSFSLAMEPTAPEGTMTTAGPGMAILHSAQAALQPGSDVQMISVGYGKGSLTSVDYTKAANIYYPIFMNWAGQLKGHVTFGALIIMLGLTDAEHLPTAQVPAFPTRMAQIIADIRSDLGEPNLPVLFCNYELGATGTFAPNGSIGTTMQPLINMLPGMVSKLVLVPTNALEMQDDHHFDMQGHKDWADRVITLMQSNGWFPWK